MTTSNSRFPTQIGRIILAGAIVVILLSVIHFATPITGGLWLRTLYDSLHVPIFGIIAVCILFVTPANWGSRSRLVATMGAVIVLSLFSESVQIPANRDEMHPSKTLCRTCWELPALSVLQSRVHADFHCLRFSAHTLLYWALRS